MYHHESPPNLIFFRVCVGVFRQFFGSDCYSLGSEERIKGMTTGGKWRAFCLDFSRSSTEDLRTSSIIKCQLDEQQRTL